MAEGILKHLVGSRLTVNSAGVRAGEMDPYAIESLSELGIDISKHRPSELAAVEDEPIDLIISLSPEAHHKALEMTRTAQIDVEYWPTLDATALPDDATEEQILESYRKVRDQLFRRIKMRFAVSGSPTV